VWDVAAVCNVSDARERHCLRKVGVEAGQPCVQAARQQRAQAECGVAHAPGPVLLYGPLKGPEDLLRRARVMVGSVVPAALGAGDGPAVDPRQVHQGRSQGGRLWPHARRRVHQQAARHAQLAQPVGGALVAADQLQHRACCEAAGVPAACALARVVVAAHETHLAALPGGGQLLVIPRRRRRKPSLESGANVQHGCNW
jgi:hypothetical protein